MMINCQLDLYEQTWITMQYISSKNIFENVVCELSAILLKHQMLIQCR